VHSVSTLEVHLLVVGASHPQVPSFVVQKFVQRLVLFRRLQQLSPTVSASVQG